MTVTRGFAVFLLVLVASAFAAPALELRRSISDRSGDAQAHHVLGTVLLKLNRMAEAIDELHQAVRLDPSLVEARVILAQPPIKAGTASGTNAAVQALQDLVVWNPRDGYAHYDPAIALRAAGNLDEAARELAIAQRLNPARRIPES